MVHKNTINYSFEQIKTGKSRHRILGKLDKGGYRRTCFLIPPPQYNAVF
jgi:hypothetical protein